MKRHVFYCVRLQRGMNGQGATCLANEDDTWTSIALTLDAKPIDFGHQTQ